MDFIDTLTDIGSLLLVWTLVFIAVVFLVGAALTQRSIVKTQRAKIKRPRLTSGEVVVFQDGDRDKSFVVTSVRIGTGSRREVVLQDQVSWGNERRHSDLP